MRTVISSCLLLLVLISSNALAAEKGWKKLTDGKTYDGWKINENKETWSIQDGAFVAKGDRSHLFYVGDDRPFVNFEFKAQVMTRKNSNGGIYFHTKYQDAGWPKHGFEAQVNNTHHDRKKTASVYAVKDVMDDAPAKDDVWFEYYIKVVGKTVVIKIDGKVANKYTEPEGTKAGKDFTRVFNKGTFALQGHDPGSVVYFKDIEVKRLP
ncbi:MAG: glycosyl hydrolase [Blastopirellula sp.]|nr:MAG: glycosyl hydrolase [Blastopirellula sp.]